MLTLDYRPVRFAEVVGQKHVKIPLEAMVRSSRMPRCLVLSGSQGTGKTSTARILAAALNCEQRKAGDACGSCVSCQAIQLGHAPQVLEVDAASTRGIDEIRSLKAICATAHVGQWRVCILDEAHSLTSTAYNALLKLLEEPPPTTLFLLLTTQPEKILETVRSRAMSFAFHRLPVAEIVQRLSEIAAKENAEPGKGVLLEIASRSQGGMRDAISLFEHALWGKATDSVASYRDLMGIADGALPLLAACVDGDLPAVYAVVEEQIARSGDARSIASELVSVVSDLLVSKAGGSPSAWGDDVLDRKVLADRVSLPKLKKAMRVLWEMGGRSWSHEDDQRAMALLAATQLYDALAPPVVTEVPAPPAATTPLTGEQIRARLAAAV